MKNNDIILLQEHWFFQGQINYLAEIGENLHFAGKGVDKSNPIEPTQMPRGYGGVAVLWTDEIDHLIRPLDDGAERIQCIELSLPNKTLLLPLFICRLRVTVSQIWNTKTVSINFLKSAKNTNIRITLC